MSTSAAGDTPASYELNVDVAHSARTYDYYLGGKDNFAADREAAEKVPANFPAMRTTARENRAFLRRTAAPSGSRRSRTVRSSGARGRAALSGQ
jgi:hypothetical protein